MSQFDLPRINFAGEAKINPATGNNNLWLPLVIFDYIQVKAVLPPRIFINADIEVAISLQAITLPSQTEISTDENDQKYFEIGSINTPEKFKKWAKTPLGKSEIDKNFHYLYALIRTQRGNEPLQGKIPGGWNYYGGMEFEFTDVKSVSVEILEHNNQKRFNKSPENCPKDIQEILQAQVDFYDKKGNNTAVMIDLSPGLTFSSQVFCDMFNLRFGTKTLFSGNPYKATLRHINTHRIVNEKHALASSGTFYTAIPLENLEPESKHFVQSFFGKYGADLSKLKGIFIRYNLLEVEENLAHTYDDETYLANPAKCTVIGSLSPWYDHELKSITLARQMVGVNPFFEDKKLGNFVFEIDIKKEILKLDLAGFVPVIKNGNQYETFDLGKLDFTVSENGQNKTIASIEIGPDTLSRQKFIEAGGIFEIPLSIPTGIDIEQTEISVFNHKLLMTESEYMVASDASSIYINQFENPSEGYLAYNSQKVPCIINIFRFGKKLENPIPLQIIEYNINSSLNTAKTSVFLDSEAFENETNLHFPTEKPGSNLYILYPNRKLSENENPMDAVVSHGFIINVRVLPHQNYAKYLDPNHPEYPVPISFELIYKELLEVSDIIYPYASIITPFNEAYFRKGWRYIHQRLKKENWNSYTYMPSSREMSNQLYQLIHKWAEDNNLFS